MPIQSEHSTTSSRGFVRGPIDAHVHVWTPDTKAYPLADGFTRENMRPPSFTPRELFSHAHPLGLERIVLIQMSFYGYDNSYMLDCIRRYPGVFAGVAVIDHQSASPEDEMRRLAELGVRGFRIRPPKPGDATWLETDAMRRMWKCGAAENLALCHLVNPQDLPAVEKMCRQFPDTPVVIDHFARIGIDGRIRDEDLQQLCRLAKFKHTCVKISAFYALGRQRAPYDDLIPMIRRLLDCFGPQRLMWATDCPFQVQDGHTYAESLALVRERLDSLSPGDRDWLLRKTADQTFFKS